MLWNFLNYVEKDELVKNVMANLNGKLQKKERNVNYVFILCLNSQINTLFNN